MEWLGSSCPYSKKWKERDELKKGLLSKEESELEDLEYSPSVHTAKDEKACSEETQTITQ